MFQEPIDLGIVFKASCVLETIDMLLGRHGLARVQSSTPTTVYNIVGDKTIRNVSSPDELFVAPPGGGLPQPYHRLTLAQWNVRGGAIVNYPFRYWKYANSAVIYRSTSSTQQPLSFDSWVWNGSPTPDVV